MQVAKKIAINTGFLYGRMALTVFISLYSTRLILQALGAKDFGIFNVVGGLILMLGFLNASMAEATQRFMSVAQGAGNTNRLKKIFNVSIVLHLTIAIILTIVLELAGYFFFNYVLNISPERMEAAKMVYHFMIISTFFTVLSVPYDAAINARENMLLFAILGVLESVGKLAIAIVLFQATTDKLILYGFLSALLPVFLLIARVIYCTIRYKECKISLKNNYNKDLMNEMSKFAGWSLLGSSTSMIAHYGQGIVLNVFHGTLVNAAQGIATQVSGQLGTFAHTLMRAINPTIAKSEGAGDRALMIQATMMGSKISFFLLMLMYVPVLVELPYILKLWLDIVPPYAIIFCQLLLIRNLIEQIFIPLATSISAVGNIKHFQIMGSILWSLPLLFSYILFSIGYPPYTIYQVFLIYSLLALINTLYFAKKTFNLPIIKYFKEVVIRCNLSFLVSLLLSSIPLLFFHESLLRLFLVLTISLISFLICVWLIGLNNIEQSLIKQLFVKLLNRTLPIIEKLKKALGIRILSKI